jgi:hypothetical protein
MAGICRYELFNEKDRNNVEEGIVGDGERRFI